LSGGGKLTEIQLTLRRFVADGVNLGRGYPRDNILGNLQIPIVCLPKEVRLLLRREGIAPGLKALF
jgi:hypothetical protein